MDAEETEFYKRNCDNCEYREINKSDCDIGLCVKDSRE
jgi:predicted nucleic-acid-binding Zn-ribbon protein